MRFCCKTRPNLEKKRRKETDTAKNKFKTSILELYFFFLLCTLLHFTANGANEESSIDRQHSLKMTVKSEPQGEYLSHFLFLRVCLCLCLFFFFAMALNNQKKCGNMRGRLLTVCNWGPS